MSPVDYMYCVKWYRTRSVNCWSIISSPTGSLPCW